MYERGESATFDNRDLLSLCRWKKWVNPRLNVSRHSAGELPISRPIITLLTDFGRDDTYVAQLHGAILSRNPDVRLVDLTHSIPPQDLLAAAFLLDEAVDAFPAGTIHLAVVDPGVGSDRPLVAAELGEHRFVAPDNGLLSLIAGRLDQRNLVELDIPVTGSARSNTFHARDIMGPAAALWSLGQPLAELGTPRGAPLVDLAFPQVVSSETRIAGQVVHVDRFGNLITNLSSTDLPVDDPSQLVFEIAGCQIEGLVTCYADRPIDALLAVIGSSGRLEIAVRDGSAATRLNANRDHPVEAFLNGDNQE